MMRVAFAVVLLLHALIHLMGFAKGFGLAEVDALKVPVSQTGGILWLLAAVGLSTSAILVLFSVSWWWALALPFALLSQVLIFSCWADAALGSIANLLILVPVLAAAWQSSPWAYRSIYQDDVARLKSVVASQSRVVEETDLRDLPAPVQKWLRHVGVVGKPRVMGFAASFHGRFRAGFDKGWMDFNSEQHNFVQPSARLFFMQASMYSVPIDGYHDFTGDKARMRIAPLSLFNVVNATGPEMNRAETVTMLNDICVMAPAALLEIEVSWSVIDDRTVEARYTRGAQTVSATLHFDEKWNLVNFVSDDRYYSPDGNQYKSLTWFTPMHEFGERQGLILPTRGDAAWKTQEGDFVYGEFHLDDINYF